MDSWAAHTASPNIKFEDSPAESLLSTPDEMYPSLFGSSSESTPTVNPIDMLTPQSLAADKQPDLTLLAGLTALTQTALTPTTLAAPPAASTAPAPEPEKKPVKKRKSWGQVLPEPKTNLPPRSVTSARSLCSPKRLLTLAQETRQD
jgi:transcriptional activator HAC1